MIYVINHYDDDTTIIDTVLEGPANPIFNIEQMKYDWLMNLYRNLVEPKLQGYYNLSKTDPIRVQYDQALMDWLDAKIRILVNELIRLGVETNDRATEVLIAGKHISDLERVSFINYLIKDFGLVKKDFQEASV